MAMILHELCTNAMKYGALSNDSGRVSIGWTAQPDGTNTNVSLIWSESGGPVVTPPEEDGFGTRLISISAASSVVTAHSAIRHPDWSFT
jgi:two-component sensor histidine kinase